MKIRGIIYFALPIVLVIISTILAWPDEIDNERLCDAIFKAEGSYRADFLYGIRSIKYKDEADARRICLNSIRNNKKRWVTAGKPHDFITFMGLRYCPPLAHKLNSNWVRNVRYHYKTYEHNTTK